ncbi:MAG: zonular occludens toxin domain-containing protein [Formivibrio sp.]|nr:zonular occludens toxin domain-containing protein [Formivibrio sp.]MDR3539819.1 zonular occludens toxin domain-containing protein [Desulfosporosinus sp.]
MSVFIVTGVLGGGKSIMTVSKMREYAKEGRRIAGNIDINLKHLLRNPRSKVSYTRVPDLPTATDLDCIGRGYEGDHDEEKNGLLILDECAIWMNAREWNDGRRKALINWLVHARKLGWDVYMLVQHIDMVDSQIRSALAEYIVTCHALDKIRIPIISMLWKLFTGKKKLPLPKMHAAGVVMGRASTNISVDRWFLTGSDLYKAYDTAQIFTEHYPHATHSLLSPWHLEGRFMPPALTWKGIAWRIPFLFFLMLIKVLFFGFYVVTPTGAIYERKLT